MNKIHNVIWSKAQNAWVVVAEGSKAASKAGGAALKVMIALILLSPAAGMAAGLPQGGSISVGQGTIVSNGSNQMVIKQTTDKLGINWQSFNVGADGHVIFDQPGKNSIALNRVIGTDGSSILGKIDANGQVFLINPNGVMFGKDSQVNVGGLVASTLNMTDADFQAGNYKFSAGAGNGEVSNLGSLQAAEGGYIALIGKSVKNNGVIKAKLGNASLAAGSAVTLDISGDGLINLQVDASAVDAQVSNKGLIKADGGSVLMTARATQALTQTVVNNEGVIEAQTIGSRSGKIFLDGGFDGGEVHVAGTLDASAPTTGNGGFIETSGKTVKVANGSKITTKAVTGKTGKWLVDPTDFSIFYGGDPSTSSSIGVDTLTSNLALTNVELQTSGAGTDRGNINVEADIEWDADTTLTLTAHGDINVKSNITAKGANSGLVLNYGNNGADTTAIINMGDGKTINLDGANTTYAENGVNFIVLRDANDLLKLNDPANTWARFALAGDIDASITSGWNGGLGYAPAVQSGTFFGTLNGLNHSVNNLYINRPTEDNVGLIGKTQWSKISNIAVNGSVTGKDNVGLLVGTSNGGNFNNVRTSGSVSGNNSVGGVAGDLSQGDISRANSSANVAGANNVGGLLGYVTTNNVKYVYSTGSVSGVDRVGGLIGELSIGSLNYAYSVGNVMGNSQVGGAVGRSNNSDIGTTYSRGNVGGSGDQVGGLVGGMTLGSITESFSKSQVSGVNDVGGLAGNVDQTTISNVYATGAVYGDNNVGGLMGYVNQISLSYSYSTGYVSDTSNAGGLIGAGNYVTLTESFWDTTKSGLSTSAGGVGHADLTDASIYSNWDIATVGGTNKTWRIYDGFTAPLLKAFMGSVPYAVINDITIAYAGHNLTTSDAWLNYSYGTGASGFFVPNGDMFTSYTSNGVAIRNAGTYVLDGFYSSQFGFDVTEAVKATITVTKAHLSIDAYGTGKTYDGTTGATVSFGDDRIGTDALTISGTSVFADKNAGNGKTISVSGVTVTGADAGNYTWDATLSTTANIWAREISVGATGINKTYDGTNNASVNLTANSVSSDPTHTGLVAGDDLTLTGTATFANKNAGAGKAITVSGVSLGGADAGNYAIHDTGSAVATINKATLNVTATGWDKQYDGTVFAGITFSGNKLGADDVAIGSGAKTYADKNAGVGKTVTAVGLTLFGADAANYQLASTTVTATANIDKVNLNVTATGVDKTYDGNASATANLLDNRVAGDSLSVTSSGATFNDKNAATNKIITVTGINVTGADAANYTWSLTTTANAAINKAALLVSAAGINKTYDGDTAAGITLGDNRFGTDVLVLSAASQSFADKNAGLGKAVNVGGISVTGADSGNYTWNTSAVGSADITKAALNVTAAGVNKTYDGTTSAGVTLNDDRIGADVLVLSAGSKTFTDKNVGTGKTINVTGITVAGADAGNYTWNTSASTAADIAKAALNVTATGINKTYDGTMTAGANLNDDRFGSDVLLVTAGSQTFADKNAGVGKAISINGITVTGADAGNYTWNASASTAADIAKAALSVTATGVNKTYDGTTSAGVNLSDNRLGSDVLVLSAGSKAFADKNAGAAKAINVNGISVTGADSGNYTWNGSTSTAADITKAALNITAAGVNKTYDGSNTAGATFGDDRIGSDVLVVTAASKTFADKNAGIGKSITVNGITVSGADAGNYTWNAAAATSANIDKANLVVNAENGFKVEGSADGQFKWNLQNGTLFGADSIQGHLARDAGEDVGFYGIHAGDLTAGSNYVLSVVPGAFEITKLTQPPVITDPVIPPVVVEPTNPVNPPVVDPAKPVVNAGLESAKDIVSTVSVATNGSLAEPVVAGNTNARGVLSDYRLLNLGMKLPDDMLSDEATTF